MNMKELITLIRREQVIPDIQGTGGRAEEVWHVQDELPEHVSGRIQTPPPVTETFLTKRIVGDRT